MPEFSTSFTPPDPVEGLTIEAILDESRVTLAWDATLIADVDFGGYRVYRSLDSGASWTLLTLLTGTTDVTYDDFEAPLNVDLLYRVTQSNLDFESDPVEAATVLASLYWWAVTPSSPSLTFAITRVRSAQLTSPKLQEIYSPIGRETRVAVGEVVQTESGALTFIVMPDNPGAVALLKAVQARMDGYLILKAPDGVVHHVQYGDVSRNFTQVPGMQEITLPFTGVG